MAGRVSDRRRERTRATPRPGPALIGLALLGGTWAAPAAVVAQEGPLSSLPGQNAAQEDMARATENVCGVLSGREDLTGAQEELLSTCSAMIGSAQQTDDGPVTGQINAALQSLAGEELQVPQQQLSQVRGVQAGNVFGRLQALRAATAGPGISIAGLTLQGGDVALLAGEDNGLRFFTGDGEIHPTGESGDAVLIGQGGDLGGLLGSRLGVFLTGSFKFGERDGTGEVEGFDFHVPGVTVGADYRITERFVLGAAFGFSRFNADFDETTNSPSGQELESNSYLLSLFGTYYLDNGLFFDGIATVGFSNYDSERHIVIPPAAGGPVDTRAEGDFDAFQYSFAANVGYDAFVGPVQLTPHVQVEYLRADIDGFEEDGAGGLNLEFDDQDVQSLVIRPGIQVAYPISLNFGVVSPFIRGEFVHEFLDDDDVEVRYAADPTNASAFEIALADQDKNYGSLGGGVTATLRGGWSLFADYEAIVGLEDFEIHRVSAGFRKDLL